MKNKKLTTLWVTIVILCCLLTGAVCIETASLKILGTAEKLFTCWDNADFYNQSERKTDEMTEDYLQNQEVRNSIYSSDDKIVRFYSNANIFVKLILLIFALIVVIGVPIYFCNLLVTEIKTVIYNRRRMKWRVWKMKHEKKITELQEQL